MSGPDGFDDLLGARAPVRTPSSPTVARTFFTEDEVNPFADLRSTASFVTEPVNTSLVDSAPHSPEILRARSGEEVEQITPATTPPTSTHDAIRGDRKEPRATSPPPHIEANSSAPVVSGDGQPRSPTGLTTALLIEGDSSGETPADRVDVSPWAIGPQLGSSGTVPLPSVLYPGAVYPGAAVGQQAPVPAANTTTSLQPDGSDRDVHSDTRSANAASVHTVALDPDAASVGAVEPSADVPVSLREDRAKQGLLVTVGDPQQMGSQLTATAHIVYTVQTRVLGGSSSSFRKTSFSVLRRYSHFLWLYETLTTNNPGVIVPSPPEKVALGRFGDDFVEARRLALQNCLQRMVNHPMLVSDPDLRLFLESDTLSVDIKHRKAESALERPGFLSAFSSSVISPKYIEADEFFIARKAALDSLEPQLRSLLSALINSHKVRQALSASTSDLAAAVASLAALTHALPRPVRDALSALAALKRRVHELEEQQQAAETSEASLVMTTEAHIRLCTSIRLAAVARLKCYANWQRALSTAQSLRGQHDRARQRGAPPYPDAIHELSETDRRAEDAKREFEDVSKLFKAEMVRFDAEKVDDFRIALISHIDGLIVRQKQVVASWTAYADVVQRATASNALP